MKNLKKLNRNQQKEIKGAGPITKCKNSSQCGFGECCSGGMCIASDIPNCEPIE
ncbi:bacteriocin-like protein [Chryseobacterium sp. PTM-20240506]|uniref:bacteriocin-like protein n=1 Tax=unclassified Chryseobacterium TaxID=2593645 RepID=UPI0038B2428A